MARHEAVFIEAECIEYNQKFYLRFDYAADDMLVQTYGVKEKERSARTSGGSRSIDMSQTRIGPQYKCPYCGNDSIVRCGACGQLKCHDSAKTWFRCSCGHSGEIRGTIQSMSGSVGKAQ